MADQLKFPWVRCAIFIAVLVVLLLISLAYRDALFDASHDVILNLQEGKTHDSTSVKFMEWFSEYTEDHHYVWFLILMTPFMSRERFWYYIVSIQLATFTKLNLKMIFSQPRPTWIWPDVSDIGCSSSFGSPSGHATRAANFAWMAVLDLFFSSQWNRDNFPKHKQMKVGSHILVFVPVLLIALTFWILNVVDRLFLGKHALD